MQFKSIIIATTSALLLTAGIGKQPIAYAQFPTPTTQCGFIDSLLTANTANPDVTQKMPAPTLQPTAVTAPTLMPTKQPAEANGGEAGGGDEALTTYRDTTLGFSIGYPRSWSQETTFTTGICFTGRDASIAVQVVKDAAPTDLAAFVTADEARVKANTPGYQQVYLKASTEVQGAIILGYEWDAGKSTVTEKPVHARTDRYYLMDSLGRLAIITETAPIKQFDPDGVRDTALTYQVVE